MKVTYLAQGIKKRRVVKKRIARYLKTCQRDNKRLRGVHDWMYSYWSQPWI